MWLISVSEVEEAIKKTLKGKSLSPDGFTTKKFHQHWDLLKIDIWQLIEHSISTHGVLPGFNATFLALIPKEENSQHPKSFRPIALCNVIYKLITKIIGNRLKPLLPSLISREHMGYVEDHQILDNVILTHELIHSLKIKKIPEMLIKLDLLKAFDKLSWQYLRSILHAFGFHPTWTQWIISLISSSFFSILINGSPSATFTPSRGIR